jgi:hypothetical protein
MYSTVQILPKVMCLLSSIRSARIPPKSFSLILASHSLTVQYLTSLTLRSQAPLELDSAWVQHTDIVRVQYIMDSYILEIRLRQIVAS